MKLRARGGGAPGKPATTPSAITTVYGSQEASADVEAKDADAALAGGHRRSGALQPGRGPSGFI